MYVQMYADTKEGVGCPAAANTGSCEPCNMAASNRTPILCKTKQVLC